MSLAISPIHSNIAFMRQKSTAPVKNQSDKNPISKSGERMKLLSATFLAGLGVGTRLLWEIWDFDFVWEKAGKAGAKLVEKNKKCASINKMMLLTIGATAAILAAGISAFALLYTAFKAPKIAYDGKVNAFQKGKEMDVYIKGNEAEKELYTQLGEKAKNATEEEKRELAKQYLQLKAGKNKLPDFIKM